MQAEDHEELADQLDRETDKLQRESNRLEHEIHDVRDEWHAKQADDGVPGAVRPLDDPAPSGGDAREGGDTPSGGDAREGGDTPSGGNTPGGGNPDPDTESTSARKPSAAD